MPNTFGSYNYDLYTILTEYPESRGAKLRTASTAGVPGDYSQGGLMASNRFTLMGVLKPPLTADLDSLWRDLVTAHTAGSPAALALTYYGTARFRYVEVEHIQEVIQSPALIGARAFEVQYFQADPFWYHANANNAVSLTKNGNTLLTNNGRAQAAPTMTLITPSGHGTATVTDSYGNQFRYSINTPGTVVVDSRAQSVRNNGADIASWDGVFPVLAPGASSWNFNFGSGGTVSGASVAWTDRD